MTRHYTTFVCVNIHGPVPAGGSAEPLRIYFALPAGSAGTVAVWYDEDRDGQRDAGEPHGGRGRGRWRVIVDVGGVPAT